MNYFIYLITIIVIFSFSPISHAKFINYSNEFYKNVRIICDEKCPYTKDQLSKLKKQMLYSYQAVRKLTKRIPAKEILPITVYLTEAEGCQPVALTSGHSYRSTSLKGTICMTTKIDSFGIKKLKYNSIFAHELMHLLFPGKLTAKNVENFEHPIIYTLVAMMESPKIYTSFCSKEFESPGKKALVIYRSCKETGFDLKHLPKFFTELHKLADAQEITPENPFGVIGLAEIELAIKRVTGKSFTINSR